MQALPRLLAAVRLPHCAPQHRARMGVSCAFVHTMQPSVFTPVL
jgi:hypothetical protein